MKDEHSLDQRVGTIVAVGMAVDMVAGIVLEGLVADTVDTRRAHAIAPAVDMEIQNLAIVVAAGNAVFGTGSADTVAVAADLPMLVAGRVAARLTASVVWKDLVDMVAADIVDTAVETEVAVDLDQVEVKPMASWKY